MRRPAPVYDRDGVTLYQGGSAEIVPTLFDAGVTVLLTDPPHWWRHDWVQREGGEDGFDRDVQLAWQRSVEHTAEAMLRLMLTLIGPDGTAWVFTHPIFVPALGAAVYRLPSHGLRWPWQYLWVREDDTALVLLGARGVLGGSAAEIGRIFREEPYDPPFQPPRLLDYIIAGSRPDDVFLDPFAGSGRFLQACRRHRRRCIGIELDEAMATRAIGALRETEVSSCPTPLVV